jgi:ribosomal protein S19E (S16A)
MMNRIQNFLKRKINIQKSITTRNFCTYNQKDPDPNNDWWFIIMASITAYSVGKINGTKRR